MLLVQLISVQFSAQCNWLHHCNKIYSDSLVSSEVLEFTHSPNLQCGPLHCTALDEDTFPLNLPLSSNPSSFCALHPENKDGIDNFRQQTFVLHHL